MALKAVVFDLGGTLINYPAVTEFGNVFLQYSAQIGLSPELIQEWFDEYMKDRAWGLKSLKEATFLDTLNKVANRNDLRLSHWEIMNKLKFLYLNGQTSQASLIEGARELLNWVKGEGLHIGLISNTAWPGRLCENDLKHFGISNDFEHKLWSSDEGIRKPHKSLFLKPLAHFGIDSHQAVYIGDTYERDVEGANSIGMPAIWIKGDRPAREFNGFCAQDLYEVKQILMKMLAK